MAQGFQLPDDNQTDLGIDGPATVYCKPGVCYKSPGKGVLGEYTAVGGFNIAPDVASEGADGESRVRYAEKFVGKFKVPLVNKPGFKMLAGYEYNSETYYFGRIGGPRAELMEALDGNTLRQNKLSLYLTKPINNKFYVAMRARLSSRGDYEQGIYFSDRYNTYSATAALGIKRNENVEWGVGLSYSDNFIRQQVWPFAFYNHTFNDQWGLETVLPASIMVRHNFQPQSMLLFGVELENGAYAIDVFDPMEQANVPYYFRHTEIGAKAVFEHNLFSWFWLGAEAGLLIPIRNRFELASDPFDTRIQNQVGVQPMLRVGLFLSPPKSFVK